MTFDLPDYNYMVKKATDIVTSKEVGLAFSKYLAEYSKQYTPYDTGNLLSSLRILPYQLIYDAEYASIVYNSNKLNFSKDKNNLATSHWVKVAFTTHGDDIIRKVNKTVLGGD